MIVNDWKAVILQDVVSHLGDGLHGTPLYDENGEYYFINGNNLGDGRINIKEGTKRCSESEYLKYRKNLNDRSILVSINGTLGNVALYNNEKCILGKSACYFNIKDNVNKIFMRYLVTNQAFQTYIREFANGSTIQNVPLKAMREYPFLLPPVGEQEAIAEVLCSLDDKIDLLHRNNETIEQLAEVLFRQLFIENALDEWESTTLGQMGTVITGKTPSTSKVEYWGNTIPFITPTDFKNFGKYADTYERGLSEFGANVCKRILLQPNSILVTCIGSDMGKVAVAPTICITNQQINAIMVNDKFGSKEYVYQYLKSAYPLLRALAMGGTTMPIINKSDFEKIEILVPPDTLLLKFEEVTKGFNDKIKNNDLQIKTLIALRDSLLPNLMNGMIKVNVPIHDTHS